MQCVSCHRPPHTHAYTTPFLLAPNPHFPQVTHAALIPDADGADSAGHLAQTCGWVPCQSAKMLDAQQPVQQAECLGESGFPFTPLLLHSQAPPLQRDGPAWQKAPLVDVHCASQTLDAMLSSTDTLRSMLAALWRVVPPPPPPPPPQNPPYSLPPIHKLHQHTDLGVPAECGWVLRQPDGTLDAVLSSTDTLSSMLAALCGIGQPQEPDAEVRERLADSILLLVRPLLPLALARIYTVGCTRIPCWCQMLVHSWQLCFAGCQASGMSCMCQWGHTLPMARRSKRGPLRP